MIKKTKKGEVKKAPKKKSEGELRDMISKVKDSLKSKGFDIEKLVPDCGDPNCLVHGKTKKVIPMTKQHLASHIKLVKKIATKKNAGFLIAGNARQTPTGLDIEGGHMIHDMSKLEIISTIAGAIGLTRQDLVKIALEMKDSSITRLN